MEKLSSRSDTVRVTITLTKAGIILLLGGLVWLLGKEKS